MIHSFNLKKLSNGEVQMVQVQYQFVFLVLTSILVTIASATESDSEYENELAQDIVKSTSTTVQLSGIRIPSKRKRQTDEESVTESESDEESGPSQVGYID